MPSVQTVPFVTKIMTPKWGGHCNDIVRRRLTYRTWTGTQWPSAGRWRMWRNYELTINVRNLPSETNSVVYSSDRNNYGMISDTVPHPAGPFALSQITENYYCVLPLMLGSHGSPPDLSLTGHWVWTNGLDSNDMPTNQRIFVSLTPDATNTYTEEYRNIRVMRRSDQVLLNARCNVTQAVWNEFTFDEFNALLDQDVAASDMPAPRNVGTPVPVNTFQDVATQSALIDFYNPSDNLNGALQLIGERYISSGAQFGQTRSGLAVLPGMHSYKTFDTISPGDNFPRTNQVSCTNFRVPCAGYYDVSPPTFTEEEFAVTGALRRVKDVYLDTVCPP
jgi:hypothetical protein